MEGERQRLAGGGSLPASTKHGAHGQRPFGLVPGECRHAGSNNREGKSRARRSLPPMAAARQLSVLIAVNGEQRPLITPSSKVAATGGARHKRIFPSKTQLNTHPGNSTRRQVKGATPLLLQARVISSVAACDHPCGTNVN